MGGTWDLPATEPEPEGLTPAPHVGRLGGIDDTPWVQRRQHPRKVAAHARGGNTSNLQQPPQHPFGGIWPAGAYNVPAEHEPQLEEPSLHGGGAC
jgi:hypothetical protein